MAQIVEPISPVAATRQRGPRPGIGLAVSGGGYRAMLFHVGAIIRLFETGLLHRLDRISSVSGGSITCAKLALAWPRLVSRQALFDEVVTPLRALAGRTIDWPSVAAGLVLPGKAADRVARAYRKHLFGEATLADLPARPEFLINASNLETGSLWRFTRTFMADWQVGQINRPQLSLGDAVAASSAFPPFLSPYILGVAEGDFARIHAKDRALLSRIALTDGGVYDNLGLETVWKNFRNVLVSDAGAALRPDPDPPGDWIRGSMRANSVMYRQVASLRKRQLLASYKAKAGESGKRHGTYWGIGSDVAHYRLPDALPAPFARTQELARIDTRLSRLPPELQERLINWGYAICDTAIRKHFRQPDLPPPAFPYARAV